MATVYQDLSGKVVLITGGANGIGASMVESFSQQGARVYFCDLDEEAGRKLAQSTQGQAVFRKLNLEREASIRSWAKQVGEKEGRVDVVINNAASDPRIEFETMTSKQWDDLFARNLRAYFLTVQSALPWLKKGASIVNFASITFHIGPTSMTAYVSTKGGIIGFTRSLARELGPKGIRVNTLSPGWIMTERQLKQFVDASVKKMIRKAQCMPELLQPAEIAQVALFLASEASSALTGQEILADRGWSYS
jgi:NAD(P)-dependent dehydrogenase (short-subunit alcohol dehydrogenase family)